VLRHLNVALLLEAVDVAEDDIYDSVEVSMGALIRKAHGDFPKVLAEEFYIIAYQI
jgi:hypothetical protein